MATRPGRRSKRALSISDEKSQVESKKAHLSIEETNDPGMSSSMSPNTPLPNTVIPPEKTPSQEAKPQPVYNADIRKSVPYFLPPPPPPAFVTNEMPMQPVYDPYMGFVPFPMQYPQQFQRQGQQSPIPMMPPRPFPPIPMPQRPIAPSSEQKPVASSVTDTGALDALAELSECVGHDLTSMDVKAINKTLLSHQYQKAAAVTSKLFQFIKSILNGSEMLENIDSVTFEQVNENYKNAKDLTEILKDWKDILESEEVYNDDLPFHFTSVESVIFGVADPNIQLRLPPYQPVERDRKKKSVDSNDNTTSAENPGMKHKKLVYGMCDQCEVQETIQWRRGPNGERSLCNACGLFYTKLARKLGAELAGQLLAQRKFAGSASDRRIPPALLAEDIIHYYIIEEVDTGRRQEVKVEDFGKLEFFDNSVDPPRAKKKLILYPLVEKLAEVILDVTNMNSKYDPSHEIKILKERKNNGLSPSSEPSIPVEAGKIETTKKST